jgi:hypothetical protein
MLRGVLHLAGIQEGKSRAGGCPPVAATTKGLSA